MMRGTVVIVLSLMVGLVFAQAPDTLWTRHYGGSRENRGFSIQQTTDGGYIVSGKYNLETTGDDLYLLKLDTLGNFTWEKFFGGTGSEGGFSVEKTSDLGYVIGGYTNSAGGGGYDFYLVKTDSLGTNPGTRTYGGAGNEYCYSIQQTPDNGYIMVGSTTTYGSGGADVYLVKTNQAGTIQWDTTYGGGADDFGYCVDQTADGGYLVVGATASFGAGYNDVYLIKTDAAGNVQWDTTYGGGSGDWGWSVQQTFDHGYIIAGATYSFGLNQVYIIKTDSIGHLQWDNNYGSGNSFDMGYSVEQTSDSGYVVAGFTWDGVSGIFDLYIIKMNSLGTIQWTKTVPAFGGFSGEDYRFSIKQTSDNGYVIGGWTNNIYGADDDVFIVRIAGGAPIIEVSPDTLDFYVSDTSSMAFVLGPSSEARFIPDYSNLMVRANDLRRSNGVVDFRKNDPPQFTLGRGIDTLLIDDDTPSGWGANGDPTWLEAVQLPVPDNVTLIGLIYYPGDPVVTSPPLSWRVWDDNGSSSSPGTQLLADTVQTPPYGAWYYVDVSSTPVPLTPGYVYVGWSDDMMSGGATAIYNAYDSGLNGYNWWFDGASWVLDTYFSGDFMIRAVVETGGGVTIHDKDTMWVKNTGTSVLVVDSIVPDETWIVSITPTSFAVASGDSQPVEVGVNASGLSDGTYFGTLAIYSDDQGTPVYDEPLKLVVNVSGVEENSSSNTLRDNLNFSPMFPNPAMTHTNIRFSIPEKSTVSLKVYNVSGQLISTLIQGALDKGQYNLIWNGTTKTGKTVASGIYFMRLQVNNEELSRKVILF